MLIYTVQKGDTLWQIARRHHVSLEALIAANPQILDPNQIMPGMQIKVPQNSSGREDTLPMRPQKESTYQEPKYTETTTTNNEYNNVFVCPYCGKAMPFPHYQGQTWQMTNK